MPRFAYASLAARRQRRIAKTRAASKKAREVTPSVRVREGVAAQLAAEGATAPTVGGGAVPAPLAQQPDAQLASQDPVQIVHPIPQQHPGVLHARNQTPTPRPLPQPRRRPRNQLPLRQLPFPFHPVPMTEPHGGRIPIHPSLLYGQDFSGIPGHGQDFSGVPAPAPNGQPDTNAGPSCGQRQIEQQYPVLPIAQELLNGVPHIPASQQRLPLTIDHSHLPSAHYNGQTQGAANVMGALTPRPRDFQSLTPRPRDFNRQDDNVLMRDATPVPGVEVYRILRIAGSVREVYTAMDGLRAALEDTFGRF